MEKKIKVDYIETPVQKIKVSFSEAGRRGGLVKTKKGFSMMDAEKRLEYAKQAAAKRWSGHNK